jgi:hypothetical protein
MSKNISEIEKAVMDERERCAKIAEARCEEDCAKYKDERDWRQPYAFNRVVRASMDIAAQIRAAR